MAVYVAGVELGDDDVVCHEGRRIVFVDPMEATGLPLTNAAQVVLPELLGSAVYADLAARGSAH